jgi:sec-independent protein translocase protein TatB
MFDIGWLEMVVIGSVALVVVGPKDLPVLLRSAGQFMARMRSMAREFQNTMEQAAKESGLNEAAKNLDSLTNIGLGSATASAQTFARNVMAGKTDAARAAPAMPKAAEVKPAAAPEKQAVQRKPVTRKKPEAKPEAKPDARPEAKPEAATGTKARSSKAAKGNGDAA